MYVNIDRMLKLNPKFLPLLLVLKQASSRDVSLTLAQLIQEDSDLEFLEEKGFIKFIKGKKNDDFLKKMRLGKKGVAYLNSLSEPTVIEEDRQVALYLIKVYKENDKNITSGKKLLNLIAWFRSATGFTQRQLGFLLKVFLEEQAENDFKYSHNVNNVFWKPANVFQTKPSLDDSRLYSYYLNRKVKFDNTFKNL